MNKFEKSGAEELLSMLADDELMSLKDTITKSMIPADSRSEAVDICLRCSQSAMQLLRRKKIRRDILMQYLAKKSIGVSAGTDKVKLVKQIIEYWNTNNNNNNNNSSCTSIQSTNILQLSQQFTEWFYTSWNNLVTFNSDHFFPDCQLTLIHENHRRICGSFYVHETLRSYVANQELQFIPNIQSNQVDESKHGLVMIQIHGTIHQRGTCRGVFDQSFGLVRDPTHGYNYLIKFTFLNMQTQQSLSIGDSSSMSNYVRDTMFTYDQTMQQQIDSTDYIIDDPDDEFD